jgi:hypothetical protein
VRLDRLLRQEEAVSDLAVHESFRDQLQDLQLAGRRLLLELGERSRKRDDLSRAPRSPRRSRLEAAAVVDVAGQDLLPLCRVHGLGIGVPGNPLYPSRRVILRLFGLNGRRPFDRRHDARIEYRFYFFRLQPPILYVFGPVTRDRVAR